MRAQRYYMLWASLPQLPPFELAERLPINRPRLEGRLRLLDDADQAQIYAAEPLLAWERQVVGRTDDVVLARYAEVAPTLENATLRKFVDAHFANRTVLAAMRRRAQGQRVTQNEHPWGAGDSVRWIEQHWDDPDFKLGVPLPWLPKARAFLESGQALELQRLNLRLGWQELGRIIDTHPFRFEAIFAYVFRWGIVNRWLSYDGEAAITRFRKLVTEGIGEHEAQLA